MDEPTRQLTTSEIRKHAAKQDYFFFLTVYDLLTPETNNPWMSAYIEAGKEATMFTDIDLRNGEINTGLLKMDILDALYKNEPLNIKMYVSSKKLQSPNAKDAELYISTNNYKSPVPMDTPDAYWERLKIRLIAKQESKNSKGEIFLTQGELIMTIKDFFKYTKAPKYEGIDVPTSLLRTVNNILAFGEKKKIGQEKNLAQSYER